MPALRNLSLLAFTWVACASCAFAADSTKLRVWFQGGRSVVAVALEPGPIQSLTSVTLEDGASIVVPTAIVRRIEELPPDPEVPAVVGAEPPPADADLDAALRGLGCDPLADPKLARWDALVTAAAERHGLDTNLVRAIMAVESCGDPAAVSHAGAVGLMQLMPRTAADYGLKKRKDLTNPELNIEAGCQHLARLHDKLEGRLDLVVAAYNAGEGTVARHGGVPRYRETVDYVRKVRQHLDRLAALDA